MYFQKQLEEFQELLHGVVSLQRMRSFTYTDTFGRSHMQDELVNYLRFQITGEQHGVNIPPGGMYLDACIGGVQFYTGETPKVGERYYCCLAIEGFPHESYPNILEVLDRLPVAYRWSSRMIYLDQHEAVKELKRYRRKWRQKSRGFVSQVFKIENGIIDEDALLMSHEAEAAITSVNGGAVAFGYYTPVIVLSGFDRDVLLEQAKFVKKEVARLGFGCRLEDVNAVEAWLGTLAGHAHPNVRRPLIHTMNLADLLPLSYVWSGYKHNPCPFYPDKSPPLLQASTVGATPFKLNLHVHDVGHTLIFGPTGSGKSVLLCMIAAQFLRYRGKNGEKPTIFCFDKGRSMWALAHACGGQHYDLGGQSRAQGLSLCPLGAIESEGDIAWAMEWIVTCYELQAGMAITASQRESIYTSLQNLLGDHGSHAASRSLSDLCFSMTDLSVRNVLKHFTVDGVMGYLLDGREDGLSTSHFNVFEIEELMEMGEKNLIPVLLYLFRRFEKSLTGQPAILLLDEAWLMLGHPVFQEKITEWLRVLRKRNCAVVLATQSVSDAVQSGILDILVDSCPTKILLPNTEADKSGTAAHPGPKDLYKIMGLSDFQINILKNAVPKREYYYYSTEGGRLFDLMLGDVAKAFVAVSDKEALRRIEHLMEHHGDAWPYTWLQEKGVNYA